MHGCETEGKCDGSCLCTGTLWFGAALCGGCLNWRLSVLHHFCAVVEEEDQDVGEECWGWLSMIVLFLDIMHSFICIVPARMDKHCWIAFSFFNLMYLDMLPPLLFLAAIFQQFCICLFLILSAVPRWTEDSWAPALPVPQLLAVLWEPWRRVECLQRHLGPQGWPDSASGKPLVMFYKYVVVQSFSLSSDKEHGPL